MRGTGTGWPGIPQGYPWYSLHCLTVHDLRSPITLRRRLCFFRHLLIHFTYHTLLFALPNHLTFFSHHVILGRHTIFNPSVMTSLPPKQSQQLIDSQLTLFFFLASYLAIPSDSFSAIATSLTSHYTVITNPHPSRFTRFGPDNRLLSTSTTTCYSMRFSTRLRLIWHCQLLPDPSSHSSSDNDSFIPHGFPLGSPRPDERKLFSFLSSF